MCRRQSLSSDCRLRYPTASSIGSLHHLVKNHIRTGRANMPGMCKGVTAIAEGMIPTNGRSASPVSDRQLRP